MRETWRCDECKRRVLAGRTLLQSCMKCSGLDVKAMRKLMRLVDSDSYERAASKCPEPQCAPRVFFLNEQHEID